MIRIKFLFKFQKVQDTNAYFIFVIIKKLTKFAAQNKPDNIPKAIE